MTALTAAVTAAVNGEPEACAERVATALRPYAADPELLLAEHRGGRSDGYARNLLHADPAGRFSIWAMVWLPGQASAIHDHSCWCVLGGHAGTVTETAYRPLDPTDPNSAVTSCGSVRCGPGEVRGLHPGVANIHRVGNEGDVPAISIHVYGFDPRHAESSVGRTYCAIRD